MLNVKEYQQVSLKKKNSQEELPESASARGFVQSKMFSNIFAEGMELVEETATYLDGEGRQAAKSLSRSEALSYAALSMRLTTRLMQIASWLLVLRAVRENEMTYSEAAQDKYRLGSPEPRHQKELSEDNDRLTLPAHLKELREKTDLLFGRIARIDADIFTMQRAPVDGRDAASQIRSLQAAFSNGF